MSSNIVIVDGHPHSGGGHFIHALADAYASGAQAGGHEVSRVDVAALDFPLLADPADWAKGAPPALKAAQDAVAAANHLVFLYPLWLGAMPAKLKGFLEQLSAGGFVMEVSEDGKKWTQKLKGKSARIIVTMGMPAAVYRYYFGGHSLKSFERNILKFAGVNPVRDTIIGLVENRSDADRKRVLKRIEALGAEAK